MIERRIRERIERDFRLQKISMILGPRQVGKTTLLEMMRADVPAGKTLVLNCDYGPDAMAFEGRSAAALKAWLEPYEMIQIDEAQRVKDIGLTLKKIGDLHLPARIVVTGSSALDLAYGVYDSGVGRVFENRMFPFGLAELAAANGRREEEQMLEHRMIFGLYPDVVNHFGDAETFVRNIVGSYLLKDVYAYNGLRKPDVLVKLLSALALQVGSEVSYNELAKTVGANKETIENYVDLLEKCFIVFRLPSFSRNQRVEIRKGKKVYFWDNGVRNALLEAFQSLDKRSDVGALWENLMVSERMKRNAWQLQSGGRAYFWRTHDQAEVDYIEERNGQLDAYEFKWNAQAKASVPRSFASAYPEATFRLITPQNFWDFVD